MSNDITESDTEAMEDVKGSGSDEQGTIDWAEVAMDDLGGNDTTDKVEDEGVDDKGEGESDEPAGDVAENGKTDTIEALRDADWERKVEIKNKDGGVEYKTIRQLIDEGMMQSDYTRGQQKLKADREKLADDQGMINLINKDKKSQKFFKQRLKDIQDGVDDDDFDIELPEGIVEQMPWVGKLVDTVKSQGAELARYRTGQKQSQANQTVGKMRAVIDTAQTVIEKETGLKLKPDEFRARVTDSILGSMNENIPEGDRLLVAGQLVLTDKEYFLSKARGVYQQERELAKDQAITKAKDEKSKGAKKTRTLPGGGAGGQSTEVNVVKDSKGNPDLVGTLTNFYKGGGK